MKTKNKFLMSILGLFLIMSLPMALGAITFITPSTAGDTVTGTYVFNISLENSMMNISDDEVYCNLSTTANSQFNSSINASAYQIYYTFSQNTAVLTEVEDTTLTANCSNSTFSEKGTLTINVDNTDPTCSFIIDRTNIGRQDGVGILVDDSSTDTTDLTYSYVLTNSEGTSKVTYTSTEPTFSNGDLEDIGEHTITSTLTDEASKTSSCTQTFFITGSGDDDDVTVPLLSTLKSITDNRTTLIALLIIISTGVIFLLGLTYWMVTKTK